MKSIFKGMLKAHTYEENPLLIYCWIMAQLWWLWKLPYELFTSIFHGRQKHDFLLIAKTDQALNQKLCQKFLKHVPNKPWKFQAEIYFLSKVNQRGIFSVVLTPSLASPSKKNFKFIKSKVFRFTLLNDAWALF